MADTESKSEGSSLIVGEVVDAIRQQEKTGQINVNILIQQVGQKSHDATEIVTQTERLLNLQRNTNRSAFKPSKSALTL